MPELPEVETIKRQLSQKLIGEEIKSVSLSGKKMRLNPQSTQLAMVEGEKILNILRRNKYLIIETDKLWLVFHLGMSGQLLLSTSEAQKHEHVTLHMKDHNLILVDPRRFGGFEIKEKISLHDMHKIELFKNLGIEPFGQDYTFANVEKLFLKNNQHMKQFLLDASNVCGIGNIYANEILFRVGILPTRIAKNVTLNEQKSVFKEVQTVLALAIENGGSSISDFKHVNGQSGQMQNLYRVYAREGKPCVTCGHSIQRITQNARSSFFCNHCQH